jgi:hypothetical protein
MGLKFLLAELGASSNPSERLAKIDYHRLHYIIAAVTNPVPDDLPKLTIATNGHQAHVSTCESDVLVQ